MIITDEFLPCYKKAYNLYSEYYDEWSSLSARAKLRARRQIEGSVREAGFNGVNTGLISAAAWKSVIDKKRGELISNEDRVAKEHPITHKNVALHCLSQPTKLPFNDYFDVWFNNLVTVQTTNRENQRLRKFQSTFRLGVDCWKKMYEDAGIMLMERPKLNNKAAKREWGII